MNLTLEALRRAVGEVAAARASYYGEWVVDDPFPVDDVLDTRFADLHRAMGAAIDLFVSGFAHWSTLIPFPPLAHRIHALYDGAPYDKGTFRTDVIFDADALPRLIEITCRFVMNGFVLESVFDEVARRRGFALQRPDRYAGFVPVLAEWLGTDPVLIRGEESRNDSALLELVAAHLGGELTIIDPRELASSWDRIGDRRIISEMNHGELSRLDDDTIRGLIARGIRNDLRTAVLVHDKAFFAVMTLPEFRERLPAEDADVLARHLVPTWVASERPDLWRDAASAREGWIVKPRTLGRSEGVLAGSLATDAQWRRALAAADPEQTVIQPFLAQSRWRTSLRGEPLDDYVVGTLLFAQEGYFGPGVFRLSSLSVTNVGDDRKAWG